MSPFEGKIFIHGSPSGGQISIHRILKHHGTPYFEVGYITNLCELQERLLTVSVFGWNFHAEELIICGMDLLCYVRFTDPFVYQSLYEEVKEAYPQYVEGARMEGRVNPEIVKLILKELD